MIEGFANRPANKSIPDAKFNTAMAQVDGDKPASSEGNEHARDHVLGKSIGGYELLRLLGRGGMGVVYLARDPRLQRQVAIKVLTEAGLLSAEALARFQFEAEAIARVKHRHIADVYEVGDDNGRPFMVMEYLSGGTLSEHIRQQLPSPSTAASYIESLALAVHAAHETGVIHRDIKPSNILFAADGTLKITDFGMARRTDAAGGMTLTGQVLGTPGYMAPEQAGGVVKNPGRACDVYALGAVLYELLTGRPPFQSSDAVETILLVLSSDPVSVLKLQPKSPRDLATITMKCLEKNPVRRFRSALELAQDLRRYLDGFPVLARPISSWGRVRRWSTRNPYRALAAAVTVAAVLAILIGGAWYNGRLQRELSRSNTLVAQGRDFSQWVLNEHLASVSTLAGSTDVRVTLIEKLLDYLDGLSEQAASEDPLIPTIAKAYMRIADVQGGMNEANLGDTTAALNSAIKADRLYSRALAMNPDDAELKLAQLACHRLIINLENELGQGRDPIVQIEALRAKLGEISRQLDGSHRTQIVDALLAADLGWLEMERGDLPSALARFEAAETSALAIVRQFPDDETHQTTLRTIRSHLAHAYERVGQTDRAVSLVRQLIALSRNDIQQNPTNAFLQQRLATELVREGDLLALAGNNQKGLEAFREAEAIRRQLLDDDPQNARLDRDLIACLNRIAGVLLPNDQVDEAVSVLDEAIQRHAALAANHPPNFDLKRMDWILKNLAAVAAVKQDRIDDALRLLNEALAVEEVLIRDDASRVDDWHGVAETCHQLATTLLSRPVEQQTDDDLRKALRFTEQSLEALGEIESRGRLTEAQSNRKKAVERTRDLVANAIQALSELSID